MDGGPSGPGPRRRGYSTLNHLALCRRGLTVRLLAQGIGVGTGLLGTIEGGRRSHGRVGDIGIARKGDSPRSRHGRELCGILRYRYCGHTISQPACCDHKRCGGRQRWCADEADGELRWELLPWRGWGWGRDPAATAKQNAHASRRAPHQKRVPAGDGLLAAQCTCRIGWGRRCSRAERSMAHDTPSTGLGPRRGWFGAVLQKKVSGVSGASAVRQSRQSKTKSRCQQGKGFLVCGSRNLKRHQRWPELPRAKPAWSPAQQTLAPQTRMQLLDAVAHSNAPQIGRRATRWHWQGPAQWRLQFHCLPGPALACDVVAPRQTRPKQTTAENATHSQFSEIA